MEQKSDSAKAYFSSNSANKESRQNMLRILDEKEEFILIGLTGRLGSGCSEFARILTSDFDGILQAMTWPTPGSGGFHNDSERELRILARYADSHWQKFNIIRGRDIITSFLLDENISNEIQKWVTEKSQRDNKTVDQIKKKILDQMKEKYKANSTTPKDIVPTDSDINKYYKYKNDDCRYINRRSVVERCDRELDEMASNRAGAIVERCNYNFSELVNKLKALNKKLKNVELDFDLFVYCTKLLPTLSDIIKDSLKSESYTRLYQEYGNRIRRYGQIDKPEDMGATESGVFSLPERMNQYIKVLRHPCSKKSHRPVRIVIDSIKNPFEALYLRCRYSAFTLIAVSANEALRKKWMSGRQLTLEEIARLDWNEYPDIGYKKYKAVQTLIKEKNLGKLDLEKLHEQLDAAVKKGRISQYESDYWQDCDNIRSEAYQKKQHMFYLQDVGSCIETADIYISNDTEEKVRHSLTISAIRTVMLLVFPGLLQPTPIERCMQIAYAAKHNSGCLSRQVGAVVTDDEFNILSLGWNDVPCGDISCSMKNLIDLCADQDRAAYTDYELNSPKFDEIKLKYAFNMNEVKQILQGLPLRYCFKSLDNKEFKDPMRARAMHAEEKALNICGERARGGFLFTTSSPCEMCSKNAKNHRIRRIYYIEPYPGDAEQQYTQSGTPENRAQHILYTGAVGRAYTQMYSQIMPYKDMLKALGVPECFEKANSCGSQETANNAAEENFSNAPVASQNKKVLKTKQKTSKRRIRV